ncbi:MAG: hypothetical protein QG622_2839 [Actinomycetota bacterium]|nr:hypothetical protein [Actinomycetota bacterium]
MSGFGISPRFNHIAIQTDDLDSTISWYEAFLGVTVEWSLDSFSPLTRHRLPGIRKLVELKIGDLRIHVFDRADHSREGPRPLDYQFQHVGISVESSEDLVRLRERWFLARERIDVRWNRPDPPSDIVTDADGVSSLYLLDPNGLELEFLYPGEGLAHE